VLDGPLARCLARVVSPVAGIPEVEKATGVLRVGELRVLVVEDNPANQQVAALLLKKLGHLPEIAVNGAEALTKLAAREFDVVLMDCQMPVLDGYEASRRIRTRVLPGINARIPIIALTAYARPEDRAKCLAAGMDDYVSKPLRGRSLQEAFQRCGFGPAPDSAVAGEPGPSSAVFDLEAFETTRSLPGLAGASLLRELVVAYLENEAQRRQRLARLAEGKQWGELAELAHAFGGEAAAFGGVRVREVALELEDAAQRQNWAEVDAGRRRLETACDRLRAEIDRLNLAGN
jgi:CheY-like chemotaxis protein/HPt (histidine-containing phosphotransfer) domain-containing protein